MDDQEKHKKDKPKIPEIVPDEEKEDMVPQKKPLISVFYKPSKIPLMDKFRRSQFKSFRKCVEAETDLMEAGVSHGRMWERLKNVHVEIEADQLERRERLLERRKRLRDLEREKAIQPDKDKLAELDLKLQITEKEKELNKHKLENEKKKRQDAFKGKEKSISPEKRIIQSAKDRLKTIRARGLAIKEIQDQRDQDLKTIDQEKNSEHYKKIKHIYDNLIMEIMQKEEK